jgi:8-amino-7-oxononanoate synthase
MSNRTSHAIAIVGMGARFGGAPDLQAYWELTRDGRDAFGPVPADRWPHEVFFDENRRATDRTYAPKGAFLDDVRSFPALHLGIPPRRVEVMDPQQRLALEVALQAIEDSGRSPAGMPRRTGVFVGVTANEFRMLLSSRVIAALMAAGQLGEAADPSVVSKAVANVVPSRPFTAPGALTNMVAAAVAQELDLHGPAYTVDAACASAMMAVADAVHQLRAGAIDAAVAGGVYLQITPENYIAFSRIGAISGAGRCRPFDARADGFVQGDGAGMLVLKRLGDALRDGDRVYAVLDGIAINNDGRGDGPMAPVMAGQVACIRDAWKDAGLDPAHLGYVEAHGTGTDVGDETELTGLREALGAQVVEAKLGSSKGNVGHTMSAAGVAGLIRAALALHHRTIPPLAGFESAKPEIRLDEGPFRVPRAAEPWTTNHVAAVSSFGFGGTNGHAVLSASPAAPAVTPRAQLELVRLSAGTDADLRATAARLADALAADAALTPAAIARTWNHRPALRHRASLVAADRGELAAQLRALATGGRAAGLVAGEAPATPPKVALLFPGQGAQRVGMLAALRERFPVVEDALSAAEQDLADLLPLPLSHLLWPERRATAVDEATASAELTFTANCQPALVAAGLAGWRLLEQVGVRPVVVGGHSLGEFAAAVVGGVLSARDAVRFSALRGRAMAAVPGDPGAMAAVLAPAERVRPLLVDGVVIANDNHPQQVVISGPTDRVAAVSAAATAAGLEAKPLAVSHAFHSPIFAGLDADAWLAEVTVRAPAGPAVASCIAPRPYATREDALAVFRRHASSPVDFQGVLAQCRDAGAELYVQVGAGGPLASFARKGAGKDARAVLTLASQDDRDGGRSTLETLGLLWLHGVALDTAAITGPAALASLPPVALPKEPYWPIKGEAQVALKLAAPVARAAPAAGPAPAGAPAEVAPAAPASDDVYDKVAAIVAKVSSYPVASLRPEQTLADDLGFDSLMVTDLATGLAEAFPGLGGLPQELLLSKPSVAAIAQYVKAARNGESAPTDDDAPLASYRPVWRPCKLPEVIKPSGTALSGRLVLVTGDRDDEVTAALKQAGALVTRRPQENVELVVHTAPFEEPVPVHAVIAGEADLPDRGGRLAAVVENVVAAGGRPGVVVVCRDDDPWAHGELGVARAVAREWPDRLSKAIQFSGIDASFRAARLVQELLTTDRTVDVRWTAEGRAVAGQERFAPAGSWAPSLGHRVVITGGTRGIGLRLAEALVASGVHVVLVGRSAPETSLAPGFHTVVAADVTDRAALVAALAPHGPYDAAFHAAGLLADGAVGTVEAGASAAVRRVKVDGLVNLLAASRAPRVVALGSWAGRFGNRHQLHYAVANAQLAGVAAHAPPGTSVVVAETGPWSGSAMAKTIPAAIQAAMRAEGVDFVGDRAGVAALLADLGLPSGAVVHGRRVPWWNRARTVAVRLSTDTHPFLLDHAIKGTPILPLAGAADLLAHVADPGPAFELRDLTLYSGVQVKQPVDLELSVRGERVELRVKEGAAYRLAYRATVTPLSSAALEVPSVSEGGAPPTLDAAAFYGQKLTFHGPKFQGLERVDAVGPDFVRGRVRTAKLRSWMPESTREAWAVDPLALDSAFQLAALVAWERYQRAGTPVALKRLRVVAPFQGPLSVDARFAEPQGDRFEASFVLRAADGSVVAWAEGAVADLQKKDDAADAGFVAKREWIDPLAWPELKDLDQRLEAAVLLGIPNPYFHVHEGTAKNVTRVAGRELVNFSSYNYLGLSGDPRVLDEVDRAVRTYGTSVSASRVASGERPFHRALESELAAAQGVDDALVFTAGHMTNVNVIGHVMKPADLVIHDELAHDSLLQGIKLSGAGRRAFRHDDFEHLEKLLRELRGHHQKCLIVVEGVYSMDGDLCALPEYVRLKKKYGCLLMVDEAHSFGVCGPRGCGIGEHFARAGQVDPKDVDIWMGTLSKSLASCGGWVGGSAALIRYLRYTAPGFVYSAGITPANGVAALTSLRLMLQEPWRVAKLQANAKRFHDALVSRGVNTGPATGGSGVIPAITGNSMHALLLSARLREQGVNAQPIVYPAVADDAARLRFFLSSTHTDAELDDTAQRVATTLTALRAEFPA